MIIIITFSGRKINLGNAAKEFVSEDANENYPARVEVDSSDPICSITSSQKPRKRAKRIVSDDGEFIDEPEAVARKDLKGKGSSTKPGMTWSLAVMIFFLLAFVYLCGCVQVHRFFPI